MDHAGCSRFPVRVRPSRIEGRGLFALAAIPARRKIGELTGENISQREARRRARSRKRICIVELGDGRAIDIDPANPLRFINHCCSPNTYLRICRGRVEFYTLRAVRKGEELTCDYGETHHDGKLPCRCGSPNCREFL